MPGRYVRVMKPHWHPHGRYAISRQGGVDAVVIRSLAMKLTTRCAFAVLALALSAAPSFAQGATQSPPSPNSGQSMPEPPNSLPPGARTLRPGSTGQEKIGTIARTRVQPKAAGMAQRSKAGTPSQR